MALRPEFVETPAGQLRVWLTGEAVQCVILPWLIAAASSVARRLAAAARPLDAVVVELPGIGGSSGIDPGALDDAVAAVGAGLAALGLGGLPLVAMDLCAPIAAVLDRSAMLVGADTARHWMATGQTPPDAKPRADGTHLTALHAFLRDRHIMDPLEPWHAAATGEALPDAAALDEAVIAAATRPGAFATLWAACTSGMSNLPGTCREVTWTEALERLHRGLPRPALPAPLSGLGVRRGYARAPGGLMHFRRAGPRGQRPVIALHSAPGSAAPLTGLLAALGADRDVIAPDYLGNGESDKPAGPTTIADLARDVIGFADALELKRFDVWGTHTGALIALETGLAAPDRVGRAILEGPVLLPPSLNSDILANYFPPLMPDEWGLHLQQAWNMRRDMFLFWPWFRRERTAVRPLGIPDADFLHDWTIGLLQSGASYHRTYRAAFLYDTPARLPLLACPALICAGHADMLVGCLPIARGMNLPTVTVTQTPATVWYPEQSPEAVAETFAIYRRFLDATG